MPTKVVSLEEPISYSQAGTLYCHKLNHYAGNVRRNFPYHFHDYYEISFTFSAGEICMIPPRFFHAVEACRKQENQDPADEVWELDLTEYGGRMDSLLKGRGWIGPMGHCSSYLRETLELIETLSVREESPIKFRQALLLSLYEAVLSSGFEENGSFMKDHSDPYMKAVMEYISRNYQNGIGLTELTKEFALSKTHLIRLFKQNFGISPVGYRIDLQLSEACGLLTGTNLSVKQISDQIGFENVSYFTNTFTKKMGAAPLEFRERYPAERVKSKG